MEFKHIRYFLAVVDHENISHAAETLGLNQPQLSLQIKALEKDVNVKLFDRIAQGVKLTSAGKAFYEVVKAIPTTLESAKHSAQSAARGETGQIIIGFTTSLIYLPKVYRSLLYFQKAYPHVKLKTLEQNSTQLEQSLKEQCVDLIFSRETSETLNENFVTQVICQEAFVLVISKSHPIAGHFSDLSQLKHDPLITFPSTNGHSLLNNMLNLCREAGFEPKLGLILPQLSSIIHAVAANLGFALVPTSMSHLNFPDVIFLSLPSAPENNIVSVVTRRFDKSKTVKNYLKSLEMQ
jgi:DNA-binding transcriptional LysR family regulator